MILMKNKLPLFDIQQNYTLLDANADEMHISPRQSATAASVTPNMQPAPGEKRWMRRAEGGTSVRDKLKSKGSRLSLVPLLRSVSGGWNNLLIPKLPA